MNCGPTVPCSGPTQTATLRLCPSIRVLSFGLDEDAWPGIQTVEPQALVLDGALDTRLAKLLNHALDEAARERDWRGVLSRAGHPGW